MSGLAYELYDISLHPYLHHVKENLLKSAKEGCFEQHIHKDYMENYVVTFLENNDIKVGPITTDSLGKWNNHCLVRWDHVSTGTSFGFELAKEASSVVFHKLAKKLLYKALCRENTYPFTRSEHPALVINMLEKEGFEITDEGISWNKRQKNE